MTKKLVATTVSSRTVGIRRRMEGMTMCSQEESKTCNEQENGSVKGKGGFRQNLQHIDGDVPLCMRNKDNDVDLKTKKIESTRGEGGGRHRYRHVEGDVPTSVRKKVEEIEEKSKEKENSSGKKQKLMVAAKR